MPPFYRILEVCLYSLLNFLPFMGLALYPFRRNMRFSKKIIVAMILILTGLQMGMGILAAFFAWQRQITLSNTLSGKLEDSPRKEAAVESDFYSNQLTKKEYEVYLFLKENIESLKGGVLTLPQPVNGKEYQRIVTALECEGKNYFYGFVEIPMTEDEVYVQYEDKDLNRITENEISKVMLIRVLEFSCPFLVVMSITPFAPRAP